MAPFGKRLQDPEIHGANGQGRSKDEARENLAAAIALILEDRREGALRDFPNDAEHGMLRVGWSVAPCYAICGDTAIISNEKAHLTRFGVALPPARSKRCQGHSEVANRLAHNIQRISGTLDRNNLETYTIRRDATDNSQIPGVRLANMHRIKGLEFKAVFLVGICREAVPLAIAMADTDDPVEKRARHLNERALLHVAATRAVHSLYISWFGEPSPFIKRSQETHPDAWG